MTQVTELIAVAISAAVPTGAVSYLIVRLTIKAELAAFLEKLNGTYPRREVCLERHKEVDRRLDQAENHQDEANIRLGCLELRGGGD